MTRIWVDFNNVDDNNRLTTLATFADDPGTVQVGATVTTYHDESCAEIPAVVEHVDDHTGIVTLRLER